MLHKTRGAFITPRLAVRSRPPLPESLNISISYRHPNHQRLFALPRFCRGRKTFPQRLSPNALSPVHRINNLESLQARPWEQYSHALGPKTHRQLVKFEKDPGSPTPLSAFCFGANALNKCRQVLWRLSIEKTLTSGYTAPCLLHPSHALDQWSWPVRPRG